MKSKKVINNEIKDLDSLHSMIEAYEEVAALRMRKVKTSVLRNREFLSGLTDVFAMVKYSYRRELEGLMKEKNLKEDDRIFAHNNKTVVVLLSANAGLFGDITLKIYQLFSSYVKDNNVDVAIIGKVGNSMFEKEFPGREHKEFGLSDDAQDLEEVRKILDYILPYEKIVVFHGKFKDILHQEPTATYITGEEAAVSTLNQPEVVRCFFEPSLEEVLVFFDTQILSALFDQAVYESFLSKFTSRMISLDKAAANTSDALEDAVSYKKYVNHKEQNKKQLETVSGIKLWI